MSDLLQQLIDFLHNASPMIWATLMKQVYTQAALHGIWGLVVSVLAAICGKVALVYQAKMEASNSSYEEETNYKAFCIIMIVLTLIAVLAALTLFAAMAARLINPEYYAIRLILNALTPSK